MTHILLFSIFSNLHRWISCMPTCSVPSGESFRTGLSREPCRISIIWLPRCTCNGQVLKWAGPTRRCSAIGSVFYKVCELLGWSWSTALQGKATVSWRRRQQMPTVSTHSAGSTQDADTGSKPKTKNNWEKLFRFPHVNFQLVASCLSHTWFLR